MRSNLNHSFAQIPTANINRSVFNRRSKWKGTFDAGYLIPFFADPVYPGDTHHLKCTTFARLLTPLHPFMDNIYADTFFFFVPDRLVDDYFTRRMGEQIDPDDSIDYLVPGLNIINGTIFTVGSRFDYMGLPTTTFVTAQLPLHIDATPFRGQNLIYNECFRDENLIDSLDVPKDQGPDSPALYATLFKRGKRFDYFTQALPFLQKGTAVQMPIGSTAPVLTNNQAIYLQAPDNVDRSLNAAAGTNVVSMAGAGFGALQNPLHFGSQSGLYADLSVAVSATINAQRSAIALQQLLEQFARGGTRYIELVYSTFGVTNPDYRLQRPEYLGGNTTRLLTSPIAQTSATDTEPTPLGNLSAIGVFTHDGEQNGFRKSFTEHGWILGFLSVRADLTYQKGIDRMWKRSTRYDYMWPTFANLGEQSILNEEIFLSATKAVNDTAWGYVPRFDDLRWKRSLITGLFRSGVSGTLDSWHLSQEFSALPALDQNFIEENPPVDRIVAVQDEPQFYMDVEFDLTSIRALPAFGTPGLRRF